MTKTKGFDGFNLAAKYRRKYRQKSAKEPWYILTNLESLSAATKAYSKRMGIEEMFRDFKLGGYNLEITQVAGDRLIALVLLISLAYCLSIFNGKSIQNKGISNYVTRPTEPGRTYRRHSSFSIGKAWSKLARFNGIFPGCSSRITLFFNSEKRLLSSRYEGCFPYTVYFMTFFVVPAAAPAQSGKSGCPRRQKLLTSNLT